MKDKGDEAPVGMVEAPALGEPVLSCTCEFSEAELRARIEKGIPIASAGEYLARVDLEAREIPEIIAVQIRSNGEERPSKRPRPQPGKSWAVPEPIPRISIQPARRQALGANFSRATETLLRWEALFQIEEEKRQVLPRVEFPKSLERLQWMDFISEQPPLLHVILQMENVGVVRGIKHITKAIELDHQTSHDRASWLFALLARLDKPYTDDVAWTLRKFMRILVDLYGGGEATMAEEDEGGELDTRVMLRCLLEDFFGQAE